MGGERVRYVHQRINTRVFPDPALLMENLARVTAHLRAALARRGVRDLERRVLTLVPARDGRAALDRSRRRASGAPSC